MTEKIAAVDDVYRRGYQVNQGLPKGQHLNLGLEPRRTDVQGHGVAK